MAGIYIHIPFCKQRCNYCDFYKTTQVLKKPEFVEALITEMQQRQLWIVSDVVKTIYFGGGTPSLLTSDEINRMIDSIYTHFSVIDTPEITLEANPDDITEKYLTELRQTKINRLSIGIQSFNNYQLKQMNRRHNANQAVTCIKQAQNAGFTNISTDIIYGLPDLDLKKWEHDLNLMGSLNIQHLSAYHLTFEEGTVFNNMRNKGVLIPVLEEDSVDQFRFLINWARSNGFEHYEISNFAKPGFYSKHNSSYWQQEVYLGLGPSAHSYNGDKRSWNVSDLDKYLFGVNKGSAYIEFELLTDAEKYNEYLMTWLRTFWGVDINKIGELFGEERMHHFEKMIAIFVKSGSIYMKNNHAILSDEGVFISDNILSELMILSDE